MSSVQFSDQELAFFEEGDTLADTQPPVEDFSDLDDGCEGGPSWVERALGVLSTLTARSDG